jgi:hypothetical protein
VTDIGGFATGDFQATKSEQQTSLWPSHGGNIGMSSAEVEKLVAQIRDHYVSQFQKFVEQQQKTCKVGAPEVKFKLPKDNRAFHHLVVVDFLRNESRPEAVFFDPERVMTFDRVEGQLGEAELVIESLRWDEVSIRHDIPAVENVVEDWFLKWFDPYESRLDKSFTISNCIHSIYIVEDGELQVDFGTAPPEAFWDLLGALANENATSVNVR